MQHNIRDTVHTYVDDNATYVIGNITDKDVLKLSHVAQYIHSWCRTYELTVHTKKRKALTLEQKGSIGSLLKAQRMFTESDNTLEIIIDEKLSWKEHKDRVVKYLSSNICMLKRLQYLPPTVLEKYTKNCVPCYPLLHSNMGSCPEATFI